MLFWQMMNRDPSASPIKIQSLSSRAAAARLRAKMDGILAEWGKVVRQESAPARELDRESLMDSFPVFLENLAQALEVGISVANRNDSSTLGRDHGAVRAHQKGYELNEVLIEYRILSRIIFDHLQNKDQRLDLQTQDLINDAIHRGIGNAAAAFVRIQDERVRNDLQIHAHRLAQSEERFMHLVDGVRDYAIYTVSPDGIITSWNRGAARMEEYDADEAIGAHFSMLYPEDARLRGEPMNHLRMALREGRFRGEGMRVKKGGHLFLADVLITPIIEEGVLVGYSEVVQDLSERYQLIQERDLSRTEAQTLRIENELRDRFVATLSHDIRNPLSAALSCNHVIARTPCPELRHLELASRASQSIERVDRMLTDLLDANQLKVGERLNLFLSACDLHTLAGETIEDLSTIHGKRFVLKSTSALRGYWDCKALRRVLENLLTNAVKYGDPSAAITLTLSQVSEHVHIKVHNHGHPIDAHEQPWLFDPFWRSKAPENRLKKGWGLGLTLVKGIVEAHGGVIMVVSLEKEGTTFVVDLPTDARPFHEEKKS